MAVIKDLGAVTAYAAAVEGGYTGTKAEFETLMASYATVAEEAAESAESASQSAESASASAQTATSKASEATTAAQTATAKAEEAQADADAAALDASQALSAASTATSKASEAAQSASDAATAKTAAQTAQTAAEGSATTAQTAAQTATQKAAEAAESARTLTIDPTLTQSGKAADSKVVGDEIQGVKENLSNITGVTKNLFDPSFLVSVAGWEENNGVYSGTALKLHQNFEANSKRYPISGFKENTRYTLSMKAYTDQNDDSTGLGLFIHFYYTDGTNSAFGIQNSTATETNSVGISSANKTVASISISYGTNGGNIWHLKDIQCEEGEAQTDYIQTYTAKDYVARRALISDAVNLFSLYSDDVENGYIDGNGAIVLSPSNNTRASGYIPVEPEETYILVHSATPVGTQQIIWASIAFYDSSKSMVGTRTELEVTVGNKVYGQTRKSVTAPASARFCRVSARFYDDGALALYKDSDAPNLTAPKESYISKNLFDAHGINIDLALGNNIKSVNHTGWYEAPENTLSAYKESKKHGFHYVETDVSFTRDNVPVLLHDNTINRTGRNADGTAVSTDVNIFDITYEQSQEYDFGIYKDEKYAGTKLPRFEDFILLCRNLGLHPYIELKSSYDYTRAQVESCYDIVKRCGMKDKVTWISFSNIYLEYIKNKDPKARLGYIVGAVNSDSINNALALRTEYNEVFVDSGSFTDTEVNLCIEADLPMEVWTIGTTSAITGLNPYISGITSGNLNASKVLYSQNIN